ncbi:MAG: group II intron reverse transcriptase domain-containing protein [Lachnospiraceae bacterium]|nr:group II intron reverse transcriptase domain-containing protein [Lachnospiraceae bacterium]
MSMLYELQDKKVWEAFLQSKIERQHLSEKEQEAWAAFISGERYRTVTDFLAEPDYVFQPPAKIAVNKSGTNKKRIVYSYAEDESMVLKLMSYLLYRYDDKISPRCFSFRRNSSAREAISQILGIKNLCDQYCFKIDISNYFNSIPVEKLIDVLSQIIDDDEMLLQFLVRLLSDGRACEDGELICEERGAMAGIPIAPFFANIYLLSMDNEFEKRKINYFRYSDDILIFADSEEKLEEYRELLYEQICAKGLQINPDKVRISKPGEPWEFLGFCYREGKIDLSRVTINKMKAKIRRKAHALYRRRVRRGHDFAYAAKALLKTFNKKYYDEEEEKRFTWSRWFFPVITTDEGLRELDAYLIQYVRYLYRGRHYKGNYKVTYEQIKEFGFRSLVHEYYSGKE